MPHDPPTGNHEPAKTVCKRLEIVAPGVFSIVPGSYSVIFTHEFRPASDIIFTGTLNECLEFVRENIEWKEKNMQDIMTYDKETQNEAKQQWKNLQRLTRRKKRR